MSERFVVRHGTQRRLHGGLLSVGWMGTKHGAPAVRVGVATRTDRVLTTLLVGESVAVTGVGTLTLDAVDLAVEPGRHGRAAFTVDEPA